MGWCFWSSKESNIMKDWNDKLYRRMDEYQGNDREIMNDSISPSLDIMITKCLHDRLSYRLEIHLNAFLYRVLL